MFTKKTLVSLFLGLLWHNATAAVWGFYAHQRINRLAVFSLPPEMLPFFKKNIDFLTENAVNPDKRRYAVPDEAPRHFIDIDAYGDSAKTALPLYWKPATEKYGADSLALHGIVPWYIQTMKFRLTEAFKEKDARRILKLSADLGHYLADANVPLHTTRNYNGQFSGQYGIHAFWESRLPELFANDYDFFVGQAQYVNSTAQAAWQAVWNAHAALDSVLLFEKDLSLKMGEDKKFAYEDRNGVMIRTYSAEFARQYHLALANQVERQMRQSVKMVGSFWLTCWIDAGQPDLDSLMAFDFDKQNKKDDEAEKRTWLQRLFRVRAEE